LVLVAVDCCSGLDLAMTVNPTYNADMTTLFDGVSVEHGWYDTEAARASW